MKSPAGPDRDQPARATAGPAGPRRPRRAGSSTSCAAPDGQRRLGGADQPGVLDARPGGVSAEACASTLAREAKPPRRRPGRPPARAGRRPSGSVPSVALAACHASTLDQAELVGRRAASATCTRRRSAPGAALYAADRTSGCRNRTVPRELDQPGRLGSVDRASAQAPAPGRPRRSGRGCRWSRPRRSAATAAPRAGGAGPGAGRTPRGGGRPGSGRPRGRLGELADRQLLGEVDQGQRVAAGRRGDLRGRGRVDRLGQRRRQESDGGLGVEAGRRECRAPRPCVGSRSGSSRLANSRATGSASSRRATKASTSSDSGVEEVRVVDGAHDRVWPHRPRPAARARPGRRGTGPGAGRRRCPDATRSACWCRSGRLGRWRRSGIVSRWTAANGMVDSASKPSSRSDCASRPARRPSPRAGPSCRCPGRRPRAAPRRAVSRGATETRRSDAARLHGRRGRRSLPMRDDARTPATRAPVH